MFWCVAFLIKKKSYPKLFSCAIFDDFKDFSAKMNSLVLNKIISDELERYIQKLRPLSRIAILGFDVFEVSELNNSLIPLEIDATPPNYCIILDVKFPSTHKHQIIGNICYYNGVNYSKIAERIHSYITDLDNIGIKIVGSVSSGKKQNLKILEHFSWINPGISDLSYMCKANKIIHFFDPSWLFENVTNIFKTNDISFMMYNNSFTISYSELQIFTNNDDIRPLQNIPTTSNTNKPRENTKDGLVYYCDFFNRLVESFNGANNRNNNPFSEDMNDYSIHHLFWLIAVNILKTMRFNSKDQVVKLSLDRSCDENVENKKQERNCPARLITTLKLIRNSFYTETSNALCKLKLEGFIKVLEFASPKSDRIELPYKESSEEICQIFMPLLRYKENILMCSEEIKDKMITDIFPIINRNLNEIFSSVKCESINWNDFDLFNMWSLTLINCLSLYDNLNRIEIQKLDTNQLNNNAIQEMVNHVQTINGIFENNFADQNWDCDVLHGDMAEFAMTGYCSSTYRN